MIKYLLSYLVMTLVWVLFEVIKGKRYQCCREKTEMMIRKRTKTTNQSDTRVAQVEQTTICLIEKHTPIEYKVK